MIRRFFTRILIVLLIGFCGYNWVQVRALQSQVADLEARQASQARQARGDWRGAERELSQGVDDLKNGAAARSPQVQRGLRSLQSLQTQMGALRQQADALWRKAEETRKRK